MLSLDELVVDPDDADDTLSWQVSGHGELSVQLSGNRMARIGAPDGYIGVETLLFTVTDPTGEQTSFFLKSTLTSCMASPCWPPCQVRVPLDGIDSPSISTSTCLTSTTRPVK